MQRQREFEIRVDGVPLSLIGPWGEPVVKHRWPGGCWELTWNMALGRGHRPAALRAGAEVRAFDGSARVWYGRLAEPNWRENRFVAEGAARDLESAIALGLPGLTLNPGDAVYFAKGRGVINFGALEAFTAVSESVPTQHNSIAALLDAWCDERGLRWAVNEQPLLYTGTDPTTPVWHILPGLEGPTATVESQVTHLYASYRTTSFDTGFVSAQTPGPGRRLERAIDLTGRGRMTGTQAQAVVDGILAKAGSLARLSSAIEVTAGQLVNGMGAEVDLGLVRAGRMYRQHGVRDPRTGRTSADVVVGESTWTVEASSLELAPVDGVLPDFSSVVEAAGGKVVI